MSDETPGAGQGALPPREGQSLRPLVERPAATGPTMRLTQVVGGQYVLTTQPHGIPSLAQIAPGSLSGNPGLTQGGVTRIISISPQRVGQSSPLRPSLANQSIVNVLTKSRSNPNVRLQLFPSGESSGSAAQQTTHSRPLKRQLSAAVEKKDGYSSKLQHVLNHRIVRSKLVKEKYNEHLLESFYLEGGNNILDLYQFAKRPKTQAYIAYLKEHAIDPRDYQELNSIVIPQTTPSTPSATSASSLPGISNTHTVPTSTPSVSVPESNSNMSTPKSVSTKNKSSLQPSLSSQELIVEKAKQEAYVVQRIADLQKEGLWSEKRLPKVQDMHRTKAHWDFLLEEMVWLAADFAQERKWKKAAAKKCARMVQKYFQDKALAAQKAEKAHEQNLRRIASFCAKEIKIFWSNVEKLVEYKQNAILEEKRKKALDQQLSFIVDQTEKYSQLLAEGMNKTADPPASAISSRSVSRAQSDTEFDPDLQSDEDDEETIEQEEAALDDEGHKEEIEALQKESQMELDDLLEDELLKNYLLNRDNIRLSESDDSDNDQDPGETSTKSEVEQERESGKAEIQEIEDKVPSEDSDSSKEDEESEEESEDETTMSESITQGEHTELKLLVEDSHKEGEVTKTEDKNDDLINDAAAIAESIQPKGNTLSSTNVSTNIPFLLKYSLREYQHIGLDWLVTMYERKLNGILADEMGLGKTIQTIALLAHLACEKENWGPHLIVVPTSVMLNWEMECKKWCPAFKILTYYGSQKERKLKRTGWTKPNAFHICITSYKLVIQDHQSFRRKKWKYLILDEAQNIKNFKSQRWQLLLNFQTQQRLLLTGTPLQNNLMELWSLMHFLMPNVFQSHREFKEWFSNPVTGMIEGNSEYNESIIKRLHKVLRPFLLRRLKSEVEKQMPKKYEHVVVCRLSKRQRFLYDDYMSRANTRETLATGNLLSVINVLMQLRKVCNHPNLFEVRPTISPFQCDNISLHIPSIVFSALDYDPSKHVDLNALNLLLIMQEIHFGSYQCYRMRQSRHSWKITELDQSAKPPPPCPPCKLAMRVLPEKSVEVKVEKKELVTISQPPPLQLKTLTPHNVMQLVNQQGILKTIPVVNISQGTTGQIGAPVNVTSLLKPADKISAGFAQLVQTSTGKHLLLRTNPNITANIPVTSAGGQKLTFLSQPVSTIGNAGHAVTQAFVKFQLTSVTTVANTSSVTTTNSISVVKSEENKTKSGRTQVGNDYIGRLYSKQNSLDVRWASEEKVVGLSDEEDLKGERRRRLCLMNSINESRCSALPLYGRDFQEAVKIFSPNKINCWHGGTVHCLNALYDTKVEETPNYLRALLCNPEERIEQLQDICDRFIFYVPAVKCQEPELRVWHPPPSKYWKMKEDKLLIQKLFSKPATPLHHIASAMVTQFPDPRLIQYDCGKLQTLDRLLRKLKVEGHRALIFTQMTKMLDVLEAFLNFHGHIYLRLDGTTKVDQRQVLMERFNGDTRIFAFILSTRSGGVGVNLTGADTVIFYDSDWNPTMDAQAQDRCHRIGQTRDVHIYRLVSERTIEENILKKANQKRLLGDLAIEGGNFTTAYFKSSTIQDLFNVDQNEESAANRMSEVIEIKRDREKALSGETSTSGDDKVAMGALENALAACEDDQDVQAAKTAKAEAVADLAEFDENIPLEEQEKEKEKEPEISKAEQEINSVIEKLSAIERYAMKFIETTESAWSAEQLAAAEREIEEQKREWEQNRLAAMREEEERRARELEEDGDIITFSREDATNQIWVSDNTMEKMPMWCPPTPPQQENDIYVDHTMTFLYDANVMMESQLPPIYVKREAKRNRLDTGLVESRRALKLPRKEESTHAPKSLFHSATILKMRRDLKLQKYRGIVRSSIPLPGKSSSQKPTVEQPLFHDWTIHEDMAILKVIQGFQGLPLNLLVSNPGHTANWDFVSDYVNTVSITYRSPKQCRQRYETYLMQREEGKQGGLDSFLRKKKNKANALQKYPMTTKSNRSMRTSQLYTQDNNSAFSQIMCDRFEALKNISNKRMSTIRTVLNNPLMNKTKAPVLNECGIDLEHPVLPVEVAARRAERIAKEKKTMTPEQHHAARLQLMKGIIGTQQQNASASSTSLVSSNPAVASSSSSQIIVSQTSTATSANALSNAPATPPNTMRTQRIIASPLQTPTVVSVSGLSPAQLQAATQRLIVSTGSNVQGKGVVATTGMQGKTIGQAQLAMIRQASMKQQLRLHTSNISQNIKTSTVTIGGQQAVVQFTQAQPRAQFVRQGTVTVGGKTGITRTVSEGEVAQLLKKQHQLQKLSTVGGTATIQNLSPQVFAQAIQAGTSGTPVATLVKASSAPGVSQTVTIPVTGVALTPQGKTLTPTLKTTNANQLRHLQIQQQLLAQKKLSGQKLSIAQVGNKNNVQTQLIVGPKPISTAMTVQQFQQVIRSPLNVSQGPVVLTKGSPRVIPVNTPQGTKQTIQVVAATSQTLNTALRPQVTSTLAGALAGIKVQGASSSAQQTLLSQVSAALNQNVGMRQGSPVRIQTSTGGAPFVAVSVQNVQQGSASQTTNAEQALM
ncbi:domino helicase isoform X2 [Leptinotarsa decemlineata]|uniref:domino helicase isoform X2 n=1 Tax=Leptinotarsa decemlineata TaxID=7539 RepID=UPI003D306AE9